MSVDWIFGTDCHEITVFPRGITMDDNFKFENAIAVNIDGTKFLRWKFGEVIQGCCSKCKKPDPSGGDAHFCGYCGTKWRNRDYLYYRE